MALVVAILAKFPVVDTIIHPQNKFVNWCEDQSNR